MDQTEHKSFFRTHKVLAFLPLLLMGAGVLYYVNGRMSPHSAESQAPAAPIFGTAAEKAPAEAVAKAGQPAAAAAPATPAVRNDEGGQGVDAARIPEAYDPKAGLEIQGTPEFKSQVTHALKLIWMADRETFLFIRKNLYVVRNENKTDFYMENGRPVAAVSTDHAFRSMTWCAGVIAHQAWHAWYYMATRKRDKPAPPPPGEKDERVLDVNPARLDYKGMDAILYMEDKASAFQLDVLKKVGAPRKETDPLFRRAPRDFTNSHDGNYELRP
jgi:hypothetical protein